MLRQCLPLPCMDLNAKITKLSSIDEKTLREQILVPLLNRMGFKAVTLYHGTRERGKDIICFDYDRLGGREYTAVVAKAEDLDGSVSSSAGLREVVHQITQCFDVPYEDLFGMTKITMDRVWVVTSCRIKSGSADSIYSNLEKSNLAKVIRFISRETLIELIDKHYSSYWDETLEPVDVLNEQKKRLVSFCKKLLLSLGANNSDVESTMNQVVHSNSLPPVFSAPDKTLARVSPYRVEIDSITDDYAHDFHSHACGLIRDSFFNAKEIVYYAMFDVDDIISNFERTIQKSDPREFVKEFESKLAPDFPFWKSFGRGAEAVSSIGSLEEGLTDIDHLRQGLTTINKLAWATSLVDSVKDLQPEIKAFLTEVDKPEFTLHWRIETNGDIGKLFLAYESSTEAQGEYFKTTHNSVTKNYRTQQNEQRSVTVKSIMSDVLYEIRNYLDTLLLNSGIRSED